MDVSVELAGFGASLAVNAYRTLKILEINITVRVAEESSGFLCCVEFSSKFGGIHMAWTTWMRTESWRV